MSVSQQELELYEGSPLAITEAMAEAKVSEKFDEGKQFVETFQAVDAGSVKLLSDIKDPKNHNPIGLYTLHKIYEGIKNAYSALVEKIADGYRVKVPGFDHEFKKKDIEPYAQHRFGKFAGQMKGLVKMYAKEIQEAASDMAGLLTLYQ